MLIAASVLGACSASVGQDNPSTAPWPNAVPGPEVSVTVASELHALGAFVLDVREPDEWAAGHIQGATLIPLGQLASRTNEVPRDRAVVVVCRSGNRSAQGRDILQGAGLTAVTSMSGGMSAWATAGLPVVSGPP